MTDKQSICQRCGQVVTRRVRLRRGVEEVHTYGPGTLDHDIACPASAKFDQARLPRFHRALRMAVGA